MNWNLFIAVAALVAIAYFLVLPRITAEQEDFKPAISSQLVKEGALLLDVRTPAEFDAGHVNGAKNIPYSEISKNFEEIKNLVGNDLSKPIVVYCASGRRSGLAKTELKQLGFEKVVNHGSYSSWEK